MINIYIYNSGSICPQNFAPCVKAKLVTNSFAKRNCMQPVESSHSGRFFLHFPLFPKCSYQVLIGFPSCFQFAHITPTSNWNGNFLSWTEKGFFSLLGPSIHLL